MVQDAHLTADLTGENFGLVPETGAAEPGSCCCSRRGALENLLSQELVPLLDVVLDVVLRQVLEGLHAGNWEPVPGLLQARLALLRHEGFMAGGEQIRGHRVQVDQATRRRTRTRIPTAIQVANSAHGGEGGLVNHPGSEEFILPGALADSRILLLVLIVQPKAQKVCGSWERRRV